MKFPVCVAAGMIGVILTFGAGAQERPNIILMMADDLGWGDPSYNNGWINTPTLDAMASEGLRFDRFYAASAVCSPTRGSCLTGRNPIRLGIPNANTGRLAPDETPLSEILGGVGYATGHFGKWHLGTLTTLRKDSNRGNIGNTSDYSPPWQHGFDDCFATEAKVPTFHPMRLTINGLPEPANFSDPNFYGTYYWRPPANLFAAEGIPVDVTDNLSGDDSRAIMDRVIPFIRRAVAAEDPFFAVVWFHTPHKPLTDPEGISGVDSNEAYTDAIVNMDTQIARLRSELKILGAAANTMLWFCSDNGPEDGVGSSGPYRGRKRSLHEGGVRVPGILVWPDQMTTGRVSDFPAVTSDYYPTILDFLEIEVPNQKPLDGISLRSVIENTSTVRTHPIGFQYLNEQSWVNQQHKLISRDNGSTFELYDLHADPSEQDDISANHPEVVARMTDEFQAWLTAINNDTPYVVPEIDISVVLSTPLSAVEGDFSITIVFSENVSGLEIDDFSTTNGTLNSLSGSGAFYTLTVTPIVEGIVSIQLPSGRVTHPNNRTNFESNSLAIRFGTPGPLPEGVTLIDDHFDDGDTTGWISQGNASAATHTISEADSLIHSAVTATESNSNRGIASTLSFDPLARNGFALTVVVDNIAQAPEVNGFFLGLVGDNSIFYRDGATRNFGLTFFGTEDRTRSFGGFGLNFGDNFGAAGAELRLADQDVQLASFQDGFTATITADLIGWNYQINGLNNPAGTPTLFMESGSWPEPGKTFVDLFGRDESWHVVSSNQSIAIGGHQASFDRVLLSSGKEPAPAIIQANPNLASGELFLQWESVKGRRYAIERSADLISWINIGSTDATGPTSTFTDLEADTNLSHHFYRINRQ